jgi:V8-like Glu-specific endopeptidase
VIVPLNNPKLPSTDQGLVYIRNDGALFTLNMSLDDASRIGDYYRANGISGGWMPEGTQQPLIQKGWPNGVDDRQPIRNIVSGFPIPAIGSLANGNTSTCTGTLISSQLVLTAAHCIFTNGQFSNAPYFTPGANGTSLPYGFTTITGGFAYTAFLNGHCGGGGSESDACAAYDVAWVTLGTRIGQSTGWMGWVTDPSDSHVAHWAQYLWGFPDCSSTESPRNCTEFVLYGDVSSNSALVSCPIGSFLNPVGGTNREYNHGCSMSGGNSGSPLFTYTPSICANSPCVAGIAVTEACQGTGCSGNPTPNRAFRIDQTTSNVTSSYQSMYP